MNIYCMNLKDVRGAEAAKDEELKYRICRELNIAAIGWGIEKKVHTWGEYKKYADIKYGNDKGYTTAKNNLESIKAGDLIWINTPYEKTHVLFEVTDDEIGVYSELFDFDISAYLHGIYYDIDGSLLVGALAPVKLRAGNTLELCHDSLRKDTIDATIDLFAKLK